MGFDEFSDMDEWIWWYMSEETECPKCGSTDIEQVDARTWKCRECGYEWGEY
jgi:ribosomal protein L37AE/L43A